MSTKKKLTPASKKALVKKGRVVDKELKQTAAALTDNMMQAVVPHKTIALPTPALLAERAEADTLIKQLTDTLPATLGTEVDMGRAAEHLIMTRKLRKQFEEHIKATKKPFDEVIDSIKNDYTPFVVRLKGAEDKLNLLINNYRTEATRRQQAEQAAIDAAHRETMNEARAQGVNPLSVPAPLPAPAPPTGFATAHGKTTTMRVPRWKVVDEGAIPLEFNGVRMWVLNDGGIGALRRGAGVEAKSPIPGIEFYYDETTVVK